MRRSMLVWRVVALPTTAIRRGFQIQRRFLHPSRSQLQLQTLPRPNTWLAKLRFRPDGEPRSKVIPLGFGVLILLNLFSVILTAGATEIEGNNTILMARMIFIQQADKTYDSINFNDPKSTLSYFKELYRPFFPDLEKEIDMDKRFNNLMRKLSMKAVDGSMKSVEIQNIMRMTAEKIHGAFRELKRDSVMDTANVVFNVMEEALSRLLDLIKDGDDDDKDSPPIKLSNF